MTKTPLVAKTRGVAFLLYFGFFAEFTGGYAHFFLEIFGEIIVVYKTRLGCDVFDAQGGVLQQLLGGMDSPLVQILIGRYAVGTAETADGLGYGQEGDLAALFQGQPLVQMDIQIFFQQRNVSGNRLFQLTGV